MKKKGFIWLRAEMKAFERRTPLTPSDAARIVEHRYAVTVESSAERIFNDEEYQKAGCQIVEAGSWQSAPPNAYILGIKELPEGPSPIKQTHIYFAHVYKNQPGANAILKRFKDGSGLILDLEYLTDHKGRRVVAFGRWAGFAGAALGLDIFCHQQRDLREPYPAISKSFTSNQWTKDLTKKLSQLQNRPQIIVIGAKGRSGRGAVELFDSLNLKTTQWDIEETSRGGPFEELLDYEILVNCVFVNEKKPPFLTRQSLERRSRRLSVIADVSCDAGSPNNPLPIYEKTTHFKNPTLRLISGTPPLDLMAIDHLPSLLPAESSTDFSSQLLPHLIDLLESEELPPVWRQARDWFERNSTKTMGRIGYFPQSTSKNPHSHHQS
ncbi:MAG: saccharopine dehydrogenase [Deltaproteobacteria bacterium]|nr:saccharopine dehydrogenase [Deltaproteobacteria bacterium]